MENLLKAAGIDDVTISWIPEIIETCRACRAWAKVPDPPTSCVELVEKQNEKIQGDIFFYKVYQVWNMLDKADRFHNGCMITDKESVTLQCAIARVWINIFGTFKVCIFNS